MYGLDNISISETLMDNNDVKDVLIYSSNYTPVLQTVTIVTPILQRGLDNIVSMAQQGHLGPKVCAKSCW